MRLTAIILVCAFVLVSCVQGGATQPQELAAGLPQSSTERDFYAEVEGYDPPPGVDAKLFLELQARLLQGLVESGKLSGVSSATKDRNSQAILAYNEASLELEWGYYSIGDYDQNGEVNVTDITPIVVNYGQSGPFEANSLQAVVDGDINGEINISDITPIVLNFGSFTTHFEVFRSSSESDYTTSPQGANGPGTESLGTVTFDATAPASGRRLVSFALDSPQDGFYWIRPADGEQLGTPSTLLELVVTPNILPVADLVATPLKGDVPLEVSFDARGSFDEDGAITKFEFDWDGALNGEEWVDTGIDGTLLHTYTSVGLFDPVVRVTDDRGGTSMAGIQVSVSAIGNDPPQAEITASPQSGALPLLVQFDASGSFDPDNEIVRYEWDLDGKPNFEQDTGLNPLATHTYYVNQGYETLVRVTDEAGLSATAMITVSVSGTPEDWAMFGHDTRRTALSSFTGPQDNTPKWGHQTSGAVTSSPAIGADGTVYVGSEDGFLYAINPDGTRAWRFSTGDPVIASPGLDSAGNIYFGSNSGEFISLNSNGIVRWRYQTGGQIHSNALITPDGKVYVGSGDGDLYCFNNSGGLNWKFETTGAILSSPALGVDDRIIFGHSSGKIYALDEEGKEDWNYQTGAYVASSPAVSADGTIYIGSDDFYLYALHADGTLYWRYLTTNVVFSSPAIGPEGNVYVGSRDGFLYSFTPEGALKWQTPLTDEIWSSPAIGNDGTVYIGCNNNLMYAFAPDGDQLWSFLAGNLVQSSPAIARDGTLYIGSEDSFLHALGGGS